MIDFSGSTGTLFAVLGRCGQLIQQLLSYQLAQETNMIGANQLNDQLESQPDIQALVGQGYLSQLSIPESISSLAQSVANAYLNRIVFLDNPQQGQSLTSTNTLAALLEVIRQMKGQNASVLSMTIGASAPLFNSVGTNYGNGVVVFSTRRPADGLILQNSFAETLQYLCTQDSYLGGATAFNEQFTITGETAQSDFFAYNWPQGSNCSATLNAIDGGSGNSNGNLLTNSDFETWSSSLPTQWVFTYGSGLVSQETAIIYDGASAIKVTGDGATQLYFAQQFGASTGTQGTLTNLSQYGVNLWLRRGGSGITGTLYIELVDQAGAIVLDAGGNSNQWSVDLSTLSTTYTPFNGAFRTPLINPAQYWIRLRIPTGTPLSNGGVLYMDRLSMGSMTQLYTGGPWTSLHSGNTPFVQGDYVLASVTNSRGSGGTLSTFQTLLYQLFSAYSGVELIFPYSSSPTISDGLI